MSYVVTLWAELDDPTAARVLADKVQAAVPDGAVVELQEHVPYTPEPLEAAPVEEGGVVSG